MSARDLPPLRALCVFEAVARLGSVRQAAEELGIDHSVASRHLSHLQERLGTQLVDTSRRGVVLTEAGRRYAERIAPALASIADATSGLMDKSPRKPLEIWCMNGFATHWLIPRLPDFYKHHPEVDIVLRPTDAIPDFQRSSVAAKIHYGRVHHSGARSMELAMPLLYPVASPQWLETNARIAEPSDLVPLALIHEESHELWRDWFVACGLNPPHLSGHCLWNAVAALEAAILGQGVALANNLIGQDALAQGRLRRVLPIGVALEPYVLLTRNDRPDPPGLGMFRDWLVAMLAANPV